VLIYFINLTDFLENLVMYISKEALLNREYSVVTSVYILG